MGITGLLKYGLLILSNYCSELRRKVTTISKVTISMEDLLYTQIIEIPKYLSLMLPPSHSKN
jgi:hypothetical protein